jgi:hypothetical protein
MGVMTTRADDLATTFRTWSQTREVALHRTAYLLTGDLATARARVRDALASALATGPADQAELDAAALRALLSGRATAGEEGLSVSPDEDLDPDPLRRIVWDYLSTVDRSGRAALVLGFYTGLDDAAAADLLGLRAVEVAAHADAVLDDLGPLLGLPRADTEAQLRGTLETHAAALRVVPLTYSTVAGVARGRRARRVGILALVAAGALAAVLILVAGLSGGGLPSPAPLPVRGPDQSSGFGPADRVPPPWVLPPGAQELRVDLETRCSAPSDQEFRSITTIQSGCRTYVVADR